MDKKTTRMARVRRNQQKVENEALILGVLKANGASTLSTLREHSGLSDSDIYYALRVLRLFGGVEYAGTTPDPKNHLRTAVVHRFVKDIDTSLTAPMSLTQAKRVGRLGFVELPQPSIRNRPTRDIRPRPAAPSEESATSWRDRLTAATDLNDRLIAIIEKCVGIKQ